MAKEINKAEILNFEDDNKKLDKLIEKTDDERERWNQKMYDLIQMCHSVSTLPDAESYYLSYRHQMVDKIAYYKKIINNIKSNIKSCVKRLKDFYRSSYEVRLKPADVSSYIDSDLRLKNKMIGVLEYQVEYFNKTIETLDKMGFVIKNKYEFQSKF